MGRAVTRNASLAMTPLDTFKVRIVGMRSWLVYGTPQDAIDLCVALARAHPTRWVDAVSTESGDQVARIEPRALATPDDQPSLL